MVYGVYSPLLFCCKESFCSQGKCFERFQINSSGRHMGDVIWHVKTSLLFVSAKPVCAFISLSGAAFLSVQSPQHFACVSYELWNSAGQAGELPSALLCAALAGSFQITKYLWAASTTSQKLFVGGRMAVTGHSWLQFNGHRVLRIETVSECTKIARNGRPLADLMPCSHQGDEQNGSIGSFNSSKQLATTL